MLKNLFILFTLFSFTNASIPGKFCGSVIGNQLNVSLSEDAVNVSIDLFGTEQTCNNDHYKLVNNHVMLNNSQNECLNEFLKSHYACPCPPHVLYNINSLVIEDTLIGNITLNKC